MTSVPARLATFAAALAVVFGAAFLVGRAAGPIDDGRRSPAPAHSGGAHESGARR